MKNIPRRFVQTTQNGLMLIFRTIFRLTYRTSFTNNSSLGQTDKPIIFISNHVRHLDPPAMFSAVPLKYMLRASPVKFMAWWKYYWSPMLPLLYLVGCFPTHGPGHGGIDGMAYYMRNGYRTFIFPEGKTVHKRTAASKPYSGVSRLLAQVPEAHIILFKIEWHSRIEGERRPRFSLRAADAPKNLDRTSPEAIMQAIYAL